jgi:large subunit ribosomal protein L24
MPSKIIKGDKVIVLTGKDKGKTGEVIQIFTKLNRALVTGINMSIRHIKQSEKNLVVEYLKNLKYIYQTWL